MPKFRKPRWLCKARRHFLDLLPKVYGPRGMVMLGKAPCGTNWAIHLQGSWFK